MNTYYVNLSNAQVILKLPSEVPYCESWLTVPAENVWPVWIRITLYTIVLLYLFVGIAVASDIFMFSIERITAKTRKISVFDAELGQNVDVDVFLWNETVANLTLMALGSSAPEILLAAIEAVRSLSDPPDQVSDSLGLFTILGSAAFNLFGIAGVCVISIPSPAVKRIEKFSVFIFTSVCSLLAYFWMLLATVYISPQVIELWEATLTFAFFPIMVLLAYAQDKGWWIGKNGKAIEKPIQLPHCHNSIQLTVIDESGDVEMNHVSQSNAGVDVGNEDKQRRFTEPSFGRRNTIRQSPFRRFMFRQMATNRLSRLNQYVRRASTDCGSVNSAIHNLGRAFFSSNSYTVVLGTAEISIPVQFQRHQMSDDNTFENKEERNGDREMSTLGAESSGDPNKLEPGQAGCLTVVDNKSGFQSPRRMSRSPTDGRVAPLASGTFLVSYEVRPGLAKPGIHYENINGGILRFAGTETEQQITIQLNDDDHQVQSITEPIDFHIILLGVPAPEMFMAGSDPVDSAKPNVALPGIPSVLRVQLLPRNAADYFEIQASHFYLDPGTSTISIVVMRHGACHSIGKVQLVTRDGTAKQNKDEKEPRDYKPVNTVLIFEPGETSKTVTVEIDPEKQCLKYFIAGLVNPGSGSSLGHHQEAICYLHSAEFTNTTDDITESDIGWAQQFRMAVTLIPDVNADGIQTPLTNTDYALHGLTFFWKLLCAFLPPRKYLGAYPTFLASLAFIGLLTALVEEFSNLLGCVAGLKTAVTGISLVALGTSLPDAFASRTAAKLDDTADNSIGNVTGSNSVNVFLGLGLPWLISSIHATLRGSQYCVATDGVFEGTILFLPSAILVLSLLMIRRKCFDGELGGPTRSKWISGLLIISIWVIYVTVLSLKSYNFIHWETSLPKSSCRSRV